MEGRTGRKGPEYYVEGYRLSLSPTRVDPYVKGYPFTGVIFNSCRLNTLTWTCLSPSGVSRRHAPQPGEPAPGRRRRPGWEYHHAPDHALVPRDPQRPRERGRCVGKILFSKVLLQSKQKVLKKIEKSLI